MGVDRAVKRACVGQQTSISRLDVLDITGPTKSTKSLCELQIVWQQAAHKSKEWCVLAAKAKIRFVMPAKVSLNEK